MSYRVRCKRRARNADIRFQIRRARTLAMPLTTFSSILKKMFPLFGAYEEPSRGFTPNENWKPRWIPGLMDIFYAETPLFKMLPKTPLPQRAPG